MPLLRAGGGIRAVPHRRPTAARLRFFHSHASLTQLPLRLHCVALRSCEPHCRGGTVGILPGTYATPACGACTRARIRLHQDRRVHASRGMCHRRGGRAHVIRAGRLNPVCLRGADRASPSPARGNFHVRNERQHTCCGMRTGLRIRSTTPAPAPVTAAPKALKALHGAEEAGNAADDVHLPQVHRRGRCGARIHTQQVSIKQLLVRLASK